MNSENIENVIIIRDVLLGAVLKYNKTVSKSNIRYGVRGDYAVISFGRDSGLKSHTIDDVQVYAAEELGRKVYVDPQYVAGVVATFRTKIK